MEKSRIYSYASNKKYSTIKCRHCGLDKPIWYFRVKVDTGNRRTTCKLCQSKMERLSKSNHNKRFDGIFDGLDFDEKSDVNTNVEIHNVIESRIGVVKKLKLRIKKLEGGHRLFPKVERTIADEIKAGKQAWRSIRKLSQSFQNDDTV